MSSETPEDDVQAETKSKGELPEEKHAPDAPADLPPAENNVSTEHQEQEATPTPDDKTQTTETKTHEEYETVEDGVRTKVKKSTSERKEVSHTIHRTVYGNTTDAGSPDFWELPRIGRKASEEIDKHLPRTQVITVKQYEQPMFEERIIGTSRPRDRPEIKETIPLRYSTLRSKASTVPTPTVPSQLHEDMKKEYEQEIARLKGLSASTQSSGDRDTSTEPLHRRLIVLESELKDSKHVSEMVSDDLQNLRKQYEYVMSKSLQMESNNRSLQERVRELKSLNKKMLRDLQDRDNLVDRLREAYSREKRTQRILLEIEEEHTKLVNDYDVLRQSFNRKEQQMHEFFTERAELIRKLDSLQYDKQLLEERLLTLMKSGGRSRPTETRQQISRTGIPYESLMRTSPRRLPVTRYLQLSKTLPQDERRREDDTYAFQTEISDQVYVHQSQGITDEGIKIPVSRISAKDIESKEQGVKPKLPETTSVSAPENIEPQSLIAQIGKVEGSAEEIPPVLKTAELVDELTVMSETDKEKLGEQGDETLHSPGPEDDPLFLPSEYCRNKTLTRPRGTEFSEVDLFNYPYDSSYGNERTHSYRSSTVKKNYTRLLSDCYMTHGLDKRNDAYRHVVHRRRPASAYGCPTRDYEVYRNPLPPRSTTSIGRFPPTERLMRSPDREFSRSRRSPVRRSQYSYPHTPDPFKYDSYRPSRDEIVQMEYDLARLKREKRHLEKKVYATQTGRPITRSHLRPEEMSDHLYRLGLEIQNLQSRLSLMKSMR